MTEYDIDGELESLRDRRRTKPKKPDSKMAASGELEKEGADVEAEVADIKAAWKKQRASEPKPPTEVVEPEPPASEPAEELQIYVVKKGDSLSKISKEVYGTAGRWREIYEANRDRIDEPNLIRPGWELRIP